MRYIPILIFGLLIALSEQTVTAQEKYIAREGLIQFYSSTPVEDIEAFNNKVGSIIDAENGEVVISLKMTDFSFKKRLMQQHFNENYIESDKYPNATFQGSIADNETIDYSQPGENRVTVSGELTIRDITQQVETIGTIVVKEDGIQAKAKFELEPADYEIKIPRIVRNKIAKVMEITVDMGYTPMD